VSDLDWAARFASRRLAAKSRIDSYCYNKIKKIMNAAPPNQVEKIKLMSQNRNYIPRIHSYSSD
jgi:hypothetical protein